MSLSLARRIALCAAMLFACSKSAPTVTADPSCASAASASPSVVTVGPPQTLDLSSHVEPGGEAIESLTVAIDTSGAITLNGTPVAEPDVTAHVVAALAANPDTRAVVQASSEVPYGKVIHLVDLLRSAGILKIAFAVQHADP